MTNNEKELLALIRENENPAQALITALCTIGLALELSLSYPAPSVDSQQERA